MAYLRKICFTSSVCLVSVSLVSCMSSSPEMAYRDAKVQISIKKAGFTNHRDPSKLLQFASDNANGQLEEQRYSRALGSYLGDHGKQRQALVAFEKAAMAGDVNSAKKVARAHYDGVYLPADVMGIAQTGYIAAAEQGKSVDSMLLLARLVGNGQVHGQEFKTGGYWLEKAANNGSGKALKELARVAEKSGNIQRAAAYFQRLNKKPLVDVAMHQVRQYYGDLTSAGSLVIGHAWLAYARKLDAKGAGQLASKYYRKYDGKVDGAYLQQVAAAVGVSIVQGGKSGGLGKSKISEAYFNAKSDKERFNVLAPLRRAANGGDAKASLTLALVLVETGGNTAESTHLMLDSYKKGNADALPKIIKLAQITDASDVKAGDVIAALRTAGDKGNISAQTALSSIYSVGGIVPADAVESNVWLARAADAGDHDSQFKLGVILWGNAAVDEQKVTARAYLKKASDAGNEAAKTYLESISK